MERTRVMVTGVYGLIAGSLYSSLHGQSERYDAWGLARRRQPSERAPSQRLLLIPDSRFVLSDLSDLGALTRSLAGIDVVVHLAADPRADASWERVLASNVIGARNVFEAAHRARVHRVVYASSVMVSWGYQQDEPYRSIAAGRFDPAAAAEIPIVGHEWPPRPTGLYPASKVWGEALGRYYADVQGLSVVCVRIGWVNAADTPWSQPGLAPIWCSQRDVVHLLELAVQAPPELRFDVFYAVSNNDLCWVDIEHAREVLGYIPQDSAADRKQTVPVTASGTASAKASQPAGGGSVRARAAQVPDGGGS
jgi:NAD+ dependent glucose-6-phosphate dehydrogenase